MSKMFGGEQKMVTVRLRIPTWSTFPDFFSE